MKIIIFLSLIYLSFSCIGLLSAFILLPKAVKIIKQISENYSSKFKTTFKDGPIYSGNATVYAGLTTGGNCLFPKEEYYDGMYAAINSYQYNADSGCGLCALVVSPSNPQKAIRVRIIDECPDCEHGSLELSDKAFKELTGMDNPTPVEVTWALIPCDIDVEDFPALVEKGSKIKFQFKTRSTPWFYQLKIFNTVYPVTKVEANIKGLWIPLIRKSSNYWSGSSIGASAGLEFRVTLADSTVVIAKNVTLTVAKEDDDSDFSTGDQTIEEN